MKKESFIAPAIAAAPLALRAIGGFTAKNLIKPVGGFLAKNLVKRPLAAGSNLIAKGLGSASNVFNNIGGKFFGNPIAKGLKSDALNFKVLARRGPKGFLKLEKTRWARGGTLSRAGQLAGYGFAASEVADGNVGSAAGWTLAPTAMFGIEAAKGINKAFTVRTASIKRGKYF